MTDPFDSLHKATCSPVNLPDRLRHQSPATPDLVQFDEIKLKQQDMDPIIVLWGAEQIQALNTLQSDLKRYTAVLVEPHLNKLAGAIQSTDTLDNVDRENILIIGGDRANKPGDEIEYHFSVAMIDEIKSIGPIESRRDEFNDAIDNLDRYQDSARVNQSTIEQFLTDWHVNFAQNLDHYLTGPSLTHLKGVLEGQTMSIIGPGPSLDNNLDKLEQAFDGVTVALDTALPVLNHLDRVPDIVVSVDIGEANRQYLQHIPRDTILIAPAYMRADLIDRCSQVVLFESQFPPLRWLSPHTESRGYLSLSGTVASAALDLVRILDPQNCYIFGIDLSFPEGMTYSKLTSRFNNKLNSLNRFSTMPGLIMEELMENDLHRLATPFGEKLTSTEYLNSRRTIDTLVQDLDCNLYRVGDQGLPVDGIQFTRKVQFNPRKQKPQLDDYLRSQPLELKQPLLEDLQQLHDQLETSLTEWERIDDLIQRDISVVKPWLKFSSNLANREELIGWFHWEIARITDELQQQSDDRLESIIRTQNGRWDKLLNTTTRAINDLLSRTAD